MYTIPQDRCLTLEGNERKTRIRDRKEERKDKESANHIIDKKLVYLFY